MLENNDSSQQEKSLREILEEYLKYWYVFVLTGIIALVLAFIYLRYSTVYYETTASIIIKDEKSGGVPEELAGISQLGGFLGNLNSSKLENELILFNSKRINAEVVKALNLNISYILEGNIKDRELYSDKPFIVQFLSFNDTIGESRKSPRVQLYILNLFLAQNTKCEVLTML